MYASTAYSNYTRKTIYEEVYPTTPLSKDSFLTLFENLPKEFINQIEDKLKGSHINTYTLTKSLAESVIFDYSNKVPICIVRPSIIIGAIAEPYPGWVVGIMGITSFIYEVEYENICSAIADENCCLDIIPVDIVVNTLIAGSWNNLFSPGRVYNCTSGQLNPIKVKKIFDLTMRFNKRSNGIFKPKLQLHTNKGLHMLLAYIFHFAPACILDGISSIFGTKSNMYNRAFLTECSNRAREIIYF